MPSLKKKFLNLDCPVEKNKEYLVTVIAMSSDGSGIAKIDNFPIFIPNTAIGDNIKIKIVKVLKNYAFGIISKIVSPSIDRIENDCDVYKQCGGCCYRHISYEAELKIKQQLVLDNFERIGKISAKINNIVGSDNISNYRNKAQFPVGIDENGKVVAGFYAKRSHRIIPCCNCKLQPTIFSDILKTILDLFNQYHISIYNEHKHTGGIRHIYLRQADFTGEIMLCFVSAKKNLKHSEEICKTLVDKFPNIKSIVLNFNNSKGNVILGTECYTLYGNDTITDVMCGVKVQISPLSFYQVNKPQAEKLYKKAIEYAKLSKNDTLLDLYCGIGTIGLSAVTQVKELIGVEIIDKAIENAKINAKINDFKNTRFICDDCKGAVKQLKEEGISTDIIIVDPPRKGCDQEVIDTLIEFSPSKIVMISCNPSTAARDCNLLEQNGYKVIEYTPFDLFPRTAHVEVVCLLEKI